MAFQKLLVAQLSPGRFLLFAVNVLDVTTTTLESVTSLPECNVLSVLMKKSLNQSGVFLKGNIVMIISEPGFCKY